MKKIALSEDTRTVLCALAIVSALIGCEAGVILYSEKQEEKAKMKEKYNSLEVLKYNADTIEFVFHDSSVKHEFNQEWKLHNYGKSIYYNPVSDNMRVLKYNGDTIQIKFENARFQQQFEKQWRKYSDQKLTRVNKTVKK